jgi:hypothetical protein
VTDEQRKLVAEVEAIDREWDGADGERRGELKELRETLIRRSDVAEALGVAYRERQDAGRAAK